VVLFSGSLLVVGRRYHRPSPDYFVLAATAAIHSSPFVLPARRPSISTTTTTTTTTLSGQHCPSLDPSPAYSL